jgi:hypothetical protein
MSYELELSHQAKKTLKLLDRTKDFLLMLIILLKE